MKSIKIIIALFLITFCGFSQQKKDQNTLLWQISGKGLSKPSYLFGTHHLVNRKFADTMKVLQEKLKSADAIVGEIVMDDAVQQKILPFLTMKGNTLDKLLTKDEYQLVEDYISKKQPGFELSAMNNYKPALVTTFIALLDIEDMQNKAKDGLDNGFQVDAKAHQKPVFGLETAEFQGKLLFDSDLQIQKKALLKAIKDADKNKLILQQTTDYYLAQDMVKLGRLFDAQEQENKDLMTDMLMNRNKNWLNQLPLLMKKQSLFIAVGAGHLVGKDGLINGLKKQGYTVTAIKTN